MALHNDELDDFVVRAHPHIHIAHDIYMPLDYKGQIYTLHEEYHDEIFDPREYWHISTMCTFDDYTSVCFPPLPAPKSEKKSFFKRFLLRLI